MRQNSALPHGMGITVGERQHGRTTSPHCAKKM
jgi:hypothetical protein